ncbi:MAG TPA: hypothetical protein PKA30_00965 [Accumulibacter sp.]|mgnify:FL=1|uniref:hypothetical protein n=2 Tax=Accumulibacter sp. TaxID=2053492 RepID=UPI00263390D6|nr:hypothetical protein [Accumulibacter sp.]MDS4055999.1 hypothetical protein [Accumulibacter sp.]HMV04097.1 hypothetical protein [Accumulibacter sp.]HMW62842.1 hypothetical protein [Accumulibacter sp.]HMW78940.1 hypothetical protein [Accumulibacter sp.]HMX69146.1 hypothetical protein [Accumulibacter sp.]
MTMKSRLALTLLLAGLLATPCALAQSSGSDGHSGSSVGGDGAGSSGGDGAPGSSDSSVSATEGASGDGGTGEGNKPIERINRHAIKSMVLVRQLLAQANVSLPAAR